MDLTGPNNQNELFNMRPLDNGQPFQVAHADFGDAIQHPVSTVPVSQAQFMSFLDSFMLPPGEMNPPDRPSAASSGTMEHEMDNGFGALGLLPPTPEGFRQLDESETQLQDIHQRRKAEFKNMQHQQRPTQQSLPNNLQSFQLAHPPPINSGPDNELKRKDCFRTQSKFK